MAQFSGFRSVVIASILLLRYTRLTNSIGSLCALVFGIVVLSKRLYAELSRNVQADEGLLVKHSQEWQAIKWESIERISYKKSSHYEWIIIDFCYEQKMVLSAYTNQYLELWQKIYYYLSKYNSTVILDDLFVRRMKDTLGKEMVIAS